jgi:hypothetical protein
MWAGRCVSSICLFTEQPSRRSSGFFIGKTMKQITITIGDDGRITVESSEGGEPYECQGMDDCRQYVDKMLAEEGGEGAQEQAMEGKEDYGQMWNQEAKNRQPQPGLMA